MALIGIKINWQLWDWHFIRNEKAITGLNIETLQIARQNKTLQLQLELEKQSSEIARLERTLQQDEQLIRLREEIRQVKREQLRTGATTATDYITALNMEEGARLNEQMHRLQLIQAKLNYQTLQGK